jgi:uncharacterized protein (DUF2236 family)
MNAFSFPNPMDALRRSTVRHVQSVFNDRSKGEAPVIRSDNALFPPASTIWTVHGDVTTMMIGGVAALLMQMLHPAALAGVWDFSNFREDMHGRLRRTARFIAVTTFAERTEAFALIGRVKTIHAKVQGILPDGTPYAADDPALLAWVHACETRCFLDAWQRYGNHRLSIVEQDRYVEQAGNVAEMLGATPVPRTIAELDALIGTMQADLHVDARTREVARLIVAQRALDPASAPIQKALIAASIDLLPDRAKQLHGFRQRPIVTPVAKVGSLAVAQTLRWAFSVRLAV